MDSTQREAVAAEIRAAMRDRHWSAAELHRRSGVSENTIGRVLRGETAQEGTLRTLRETLGLQQAVLERKSDQGEYPPNIVAVQLMVGAVMARLPESEWQAIGNGIAAWLLDRGWEKD